MVLWLVPNSRNHALIAPTDKRELSPACDLTPIPLLSRERRDLAMTGGRFNRYANRVNLLSEHAQFKLSLDQTREIVDAVERIVAGRWLAVLRQHGVSERKCARLAPVFDYPGFELDPAVVLMASWA